MAGKATKPKGEKNELDVEIIPVTRGSITAYLVGETPLIMNRLSEKTKQQLLLPSGKKTAVEKQMSLKHDPVAEFQAAPHRLADPAAPTLLAMSSTSFKKALGTAALDMPGAKKSQIGRLTFVPGQYVPIYGVPKLFMKPVRSADMNRTPDIRTRAILHDWACKVTITYAEPLIKPKAVVNLLAAAGIYVGIGDWRPEKGSGDYGQYRLVDPDDPKFAEIVAECGRDEQVEALDNPQPYDDETAELLDWYQTEVLKRRAKGAA